MKKQIITAIAIVFVVMYLSNVFLTLEFDFRCWSEENRIIYLVLFMVFSFVSSWGIAYLNRYKL